MTKQAQICECCWKRPITYTAYREVGFGVQVIVAKVCRPCKRKMEGKN